MTILTVCCCCLELELGVAVLGWLGAICSVLNIASTIVALATEGHFHGQVILYLISALLQFAVSVCLIKATQTKNKRLLVPWLAVTMINIIVVTLVFIIVGALAAHTQQFFALIGIILVADAVGLYFWLCVYSYYQELDACV